jgi:acetoacetyl-CoA reductase/3-oxoacyl-[acyl-carrier protein] reductase
MPEKVVWVTGGSRGIGRAIAVELAEKGYRVVFTFLKNRDLAGRMVRQLETRGYDLLALPMAVEDPESVKGTVADIHARLGPIDILVNNAAIAQEQSFDSITEKDWDQVMAVNLRGPFTCCRCALPDMLARSWGRIVNIVSIGGQWGGCNQVHYAAAKAGLINLTRSLARLYSSRGVTANAVSPGLVDTDMVAEELNTEAGREKVRAIPVGRIATPEEIAHVVAFLVADEAGYVTGQTLNANGGMLFT